MFAYYLRLAAISMRKTPGATALMVSTIALGIGIYMASLTVFYQMAANPVEHKNDVLHAVQIDSWDPAEPYTDRQPEQAPWELTYRDAMALMTSDIPVRHAAMYKTELVLQPGRRELKPFAEMGRITGRDFFALFDISFVYGAPWTEEADETGARQIVISRQLNGELFGGGDSIGETLVVHDRPFTVIGVVEDFQPTPKFYDVNNGAFDESERLFLPVGVGRELELFSSGNTNCWKDEKIETYEQFLNSECVWWQYWAELENPGQKADFQAFVDGYVTSQKALGRFGRPLNNRLTPVDGWLEARRVVRDDQKVLVAVATLFLGVCLFNTLGLMLAKFLGRAPQVGIRRALGASRKAVFRQQLIEVGVIGFAGGVIGLGLAWLSLRGIRRLFPGFEQLTHLDWTLAGVAVASAILTTLVAGLYPSCRDCRMPPAAYLRNQ